MKAEKRVGNDTEGLEIVKEIDDFVNELFEKNSNMRLVRNAASYDGAREYITNRLNTKYKALIDKGWESRDALTRVLAEFGADEGVVRAVAFEELKLSYEKFDKSYKTLQTIGFAGVIIWPLLFVIFMFAVDVESKITFLVIWIVYLLLLAAYVITINYIDYRFKEKFKKEEERDK